MSRRRSRSNAIITIYWRDIPAQVSAGSGDDEHKALLDDRFQHAIDRAATVAGLTTTHDYVGQWRQERSPLTGDAIDEVARRAADLDHTYDHKRLEQLVANGGLEP